MKLFLECIISLILFCSVSFAGTRYEKDKIVVSNDLVTTSNLYFLGLLFSNGTTTNWIVDTNGNLVPFTNWQTETWTPFTNAVTNLINTGSGIFTNIDTSAGDVNYVLTNPTTIINYIYKTNALNNVNVIYLSTTNSVSGITVIECLPIPTNNWIIRY